jgi:PBSX family phage portal protein
MESKSEEGKAPEAVDPEQPVRKIRARIIDVSPIVKRIEEQLGQSNVVLEDPDLSAYVDAGRVIEPPYDPLGLSTMIENSTHLEQNIAALEINIDGFGHKFVRRVQLGDQASDGLKAEVRKEGIFLENLFAHFCLDYSFVAFRRRVRRDLEATGNAYFELVANKAGRIDQLVHVPSYQMRLTPIDKELTPFDQKRLVRIDDGSVAVEVAKAKKRFRRIVQFSRLGTDGRWKTAYDRPVYFKEFGDPRAINAETGDPVTEKEMKEGSVKLATPMVHFKLYCPRSPYGLPRWIGNLITLFGDREADGVNYTTFANNMMPSMIIIVSGGALTQGSLDRIKQFSEQQIAGSGNRSKFLLIEAESPFAQEPGETGSPKLELERLTNDQIQDQLFQAYGENNRKKVRESFRLPPIFCGDAKTYNRATAEASRKLADEQIFAPERNEFDHWVNHRLFPVMEIKYHRFQSLGPNVTDDEDLIKVLLAAEKTGGMTPRIARIIIEDIMGREFPENWKDMDPDVPLTLQIAERVKNSAPAGISTQVAPVGVDTATMKSLLGNDEDALVVLNSLLKLRAWMEAELEGGEKPDA